MLMVNRYYKYIYKHYLDGHNTVAIDVYKPSKRLHNWLLKHLLVSEITNKYSFIIDKSVFINGGYSWQLSPGVGAAPNWKLS